MIKYPLEKEDIDNPEKLEGTWVYEDEFVKGFINLDNTAITDLYVDSFFENQGIGRWYNRIYCGAKTINLHLERG